MSTDYETSSPLLESPNDQPAPDQDEQIENESGEESLIDFNTSITFQSPSDQNNQIHENQTAGGETSIHVGNFEGSLDQAPNQNVRNENDQPGGDQPPNNGRPMVTDFQTSKRWSIVRVPAHTREVDDKAYNPKLLSIGPFHFNETSLKLMESHKLRFVTRLQEKIGRDDLLDHLEYPTKSSEKEIRECYSEQFEHISTNDFVRMLVVDAVFIVEFLRLHEKGSQGEDVEEPIFGTRWMLPIIGRDLLLLENQLPMFVLEKIYDLTTLSNTQTPLEELAVQFFKTLRPLPERLPREGTSTSTTTGRPRYSHLLDLFQCTFVARSVVQSSSPRSDKLPQRDWINNNLERISLSGVRFCAKEGDDLLAIEYFRGELRIPTLMLDDDTIHLLRNLIGYEQSSRYVIPYVTCLAIFLDSIVDTPDDIILLRDKGIIKQAKGSNEEILDLLKSLSRDQQEFDTKHCYLIKQIEGINNFCDTFGARFTRITSVFMKKSPHLLRSAMLSYLSLVQTLLYNSVRINSPTTFPAPASAAAPGPNPFR